MPIAPKQPEKPPAAYWYGFTASGGWVFGWPVLYAVFEPAQKNAAFYWLSHAAATLWLFSLIAFVVFFALLTEYSPTLSAICEGLGFIFELLSFLGDLLSLLF